jgi:hypothetical protein
MASIQIACRLVSIPSLFEMYDEDMTSLFELRCYEESKCYMIGTVEGTLGINADMQLNSLS